jgi:hypothetical protein
MDGGERARPWTTNGREKNSPTKRRKQIANKNEEQAQRARE